MKLLAHMKQLDAELIEELNENKQNNGVYYLNVKVIFNKLH